MTAFAYLAPLFPRFVALGRVIHIQHGDSSHALAAILFTTRAAYFSSGS
jgi:hypothetical protein